MFAELNTLFADTAVHAGAAFVKVLPWVLVATLVLMVLHLLLAIKGGRTTEPKSRWNLWEKLVYLGTVASVTTLGFTSFYGMITTGSLGGWLLFFHMFGAGLFTCVLPVLALTWGDVNVFGATPAPARPGAEPLAPRFFWLPKLMFWTVLVAGFLVTMTMLLSMLPVFGTDGLHLLLDVHRWAGLVAVVAAILHLYSVVLQTIKLR